MKTNTILEEVVALKLAQYIKAQYPTLLYRFDLGADAFVSKTQRRRKLALQMKENGYPDLFVASARNGYFGLYIELKKRRSDVYKLDGEFIKSEHIERQHKMHERLREEGYRVLWGLGFDDAKQKLDRYLKGY